MSRFVVFLILLAVLAWFAPTIVANTPLWGYLLTQANARLPVKVSAGKPQLGWLSPVELTAVKVEDAKGKELVAVDAVRLPYVGPDHQARLERRIGKGLGETDRPGKGRAAGLIGHELDAGQQAAAADIAHVGQLAEPLQPPVEVRPHGGAALDQGVLAEVPQGRHAGRAERGMMRECLGVE